MSVGYSKERAEVIDFAAPYAPYYIAVIGPAALKVSGKEDLADKTIAVNRGTLEDTEVTKVAPQGADIQRYSDYNGVISAFLSGQAQLMVVGNDVGATILAKNPAIEPVEKFQLLTSPSHMGVKKGETALQEKVNTALIAMKKDGSLNEIAVKWLKQPLPAGF
jgi:polar amino acid transport system substrate-binding protein